MKRYICGLFALVMSTVVFGGSYEASFGVRLLDEDGQPVTNAIVRAGFWRAKPSGYGGGIEVNERFTKLTDTNGICNFSGHCIDVAYVSWGAEKNGYYATLGMKPAFTNDGISGRLEPWNKMYEATLRKIVKPITMYHCDLNQKWPPMKVPELGKVFGFDLMKSDWVAPYGKGETVDILIQIDVEKTIMTEDYLQKNPESSKESIRNVFTLTFPNPDDGIQIYCQQPREGSVFRLPRYAPESGFETNFVREYRIGAGAGNNIEMQREDLNYLFRVRTKRDEHGKMVSALYGKIEGRINFGDIGKTGWLKFHYYLNPTVNDRNLEHDPNRNLLDRLGTGNR